MNAHIKQIREDLQAISGFISSRLTSRVDQQEVDSLIHNIEGSLVILELSEGDEDLQSAVRSALDEIERQDAEWGANRVHSLGKWLTILVEEVGEIAKAINDLDHAKGARLAELVRNHEKEWVQVAAVAIQRVKAIRRAERLLTSGQ